MTDTSEPMGWCTNWSAFGMRELRAMVAGEDNPRGWDQTTTWRTLEDAVQTQRDRLAACKSALLETWPPEKSPAAAAFVAEIDKLTTSMTEAGVAASQNMTGLAGVMSALADAKRKLEPLASEYEDKSGDWIPSFVDNAEDELTEQARQVMADTDLAVSQHSANLVPIPTYEMVAPVTSDTPDAPGGGGSTGGGAAGSGGAVAPAAPLVHQPPAPLPGRNPVMPDGQEWTSGVRPVGSEVGLAGVVTPPAPPPPVTPVPPPPPVVPAPPVVPPVPIVGGPGLPPVAGGPFGAPITPPPNGVIGPRPGGIRPGGQPVGTIRPGAVGGTGMPRPAMPPGGVIGGSAAGARTGAAGRAAAPVTGARPGGAAATATAGRARRGPADRAEPGAKGEADNVWEAAEGVPPVIQPPADPRRPDPGPSVIGLDR